MARRPHRSQSVPQSKGFGASVAAPTGSGPWEVAICPLAMRVQDDDDQWFQPSVLLVVEASGLVRAMQPERPERALAALPAVIEQAIYAPAAGCRRGLPSRVVVADAALLQPLQALLPGISLRKGPTPLADEALVALGRTLEHDDIEELLGADAQAVAALFDDNDQQQAPWDTYLTADCTPAAVSGLFEAAAALHQRAPWDRFPQQGHLFRVACSPLKIKQWVGFAIGGDGDEPGIVLFRSADEYWDYEQLADLVQQRRAPADAPWPRHIAINFRAFDDLEAVQQTEITRHGWPLDSKQACPQIMLVEPDRTFALPSAAVLQQLQAVVWSLVHWIDDGEGDGPTRWLMREQPRRYQVPGADGMIPVSIGAYAGPQRHGSALEDALANRVQSLLQRLDAFCHAQLDDDYRQLLHKAVQQLASLQPSPLLKGREPSWCAGLVHAIGLANFLFERTQRPQRPRCTISEAFAFFGVSSSVGYAHSKKVRELLRIEPLTKTWTLAGLQQQGPDSLMVQLNGFSVDARQLPASVTLQLAAKALGGLAGR
jgi:hypothetical protein